MPDIAGLFALCKIVWSIWKIWKIISMRESSLDLESRENKMLLNGTEIIQLEPSNTELSSLEMKSYTHKDEAQGKTIEARIFYSMKLNELIWDKHFNNEDFKIVIKQDKHRKVREFIKENETILSDFLRYQYSFSNNNRKEFFNEAKLCLSQDIKLNSNDVVCHKGAYFDSFLTNDVCKKSLKRIESQAGDTLVDGRQFFPYDKDTEGTFRLHTIANSIMDNHIGISTIGFTADNHIKIWRQSVKAQQSEGFYAPTGSGSCDWDDKTNDKFLATLKSAMERELKEESQKRCTNANLIKIDSTIVLGFFRWVNRGGNPDFVGITKLKCNHDVLEPNVDEVQDPQRAETAIPIQSIDDLPKKIDSIISRGGISVPLYMNLFMLKEFCARHKENLGEFLFE